MDSLYRGELISKDDFILKLDEFKSTIENDLLHNQLDPQIVIDALDRLANEIDKQSIIDKLVALDMPKYAIEEFIDVSLRSITKEEITNKMKRELGENPFEWKVIREGIKEKLVPFGVLMHIGAGNALGLSAMSVLEGLLTGNINILKLPEHEGGISSDILLKLVEIEPRLKPYIYVINVSSSNEVVIKKLIELVDNVVVWGGDNAVSAIRQLVPPTISLTEWGHRLSFSYFTNNSNLESDLKGLAKDIVLTDQLYCSSPQCVFFETDDFKELDVFGKKLFNELSVLSEKHPPVYKSLDIQSQITWTHELLNMEEILDKKKLLTNSNKDFSVMIDYIPSLKVSPLFRNIWLMPIKRSEILGLLRKEKGHLQTVGLSCTKDEIEDLSKLFYASGINRVMKLGLMSSNYSGEPHDGIYALRRYVRIVNKRVK